MKYILPILLVLAMSFSSCGVFVAGIVGAGVGVSQFNNKRFRPPASFDSTLAKIEEIGIDTMLVEEEIEGEAKIEEITVEVEERIEERIEEIKDTTKPDRTLPPDLLGGDEEENVNTTKLKTYEVEVDLGTIEYGDSIRHTFKYKNIGSTDFIIEQYTVGCGCTEISSPKKRLAPGESGEITLQFNSKEKEGPGDYTSDAMLIGNVPDGFVEFMMKIKVVKKKE